MAGFRHLISCMMRWNCSFKRKEKFHLNHYPFYTSTDVNNNGAYMRVSALCSLKDFLYRAALDDHFFQVPWISSWISHLDYPLVNQTWKTCHPTNYFFLNLCPKRKILENFVADMKTIRFLRFETWPNIIFFLFWNDDFRIGILIFRK